MQSDIEKERTRVETDILEDTEKRIKSLRDTSSKKQKAAYEAVYRMLVGEG